MKKIIFSLLIIGFVFTTGSVNAQFRSIPGIVTDSFKAKYPNASSVNWSDKLTSFQASFMLDKEKYLAWYSSKGEWQKSEKKIFKDAIPASVNDGLSKSKYSDWPVSSVTHIEFKDGHIEYRILVRKSDIEKRYLSFTDQGKLLRDAMTI